MKKIAYIVLLFLLVSCQEYEYIRFETAQPTNTKAQNFFSRKIKGEYINCLDESERLIISDKSIIGHKKTIVSFYKRDFDTDSTILTDEEILSVFADKNCNVKIIGDSIKGICIDIDTVFYLSDQHILKRVKGSYFLNRKESKNFWSVNRLSLTNDSLFIGYIFPSDTLLNYGFVSKNETADEKGEIESIEYLISPSKKEFKEIANSDIFIEENCYYKTK
ncbi:hypothetical protein [Bernardetia sp.]|uniref:hypothetical protein n=1 Tax=Bernardetia sp. TaxID=1937974 RepID=UPI0025BA8238|nr:hypothetical protein [Bernardetia sp.]